MGLLPSLLKTVSIISVDSFRAVAFDVLKVFVGYPLRLIIATVRSVRKILGMKVRPSLQV